METWSNFLIDNVTTAALLDPILAIGPILYTLKTLENLWFSVAFRSYTMETFTRNG